MMCNAEVYRYEPTYRDLFDHLERECNFHDINGKATWKCDGRLTMTEQYCKDHNLNFKTISDTLMFHGGYCDCEVLLNIVDSMDEDKPLERL